MLESLIARLSEAQSLTAQQTAGAVAELVDEKVSPELKAEFLSALARKGESTDEIASFAEELRARSVPLPLDEETPSREILDVCGTGGDRLNTFNISTGVALIVSSGGVTVAKHGNRAITSQAGSADVLEELGVPVELTPEEAALSLKEKNFAFLFAPKFHPAFKHIGPARKLCAERGQRTIFNFLGPLLNPARPTAQLIGVPRPELCQPIATVLKKLGVRRGMVVCGQVEQFWLDELSTLGASHITEFYHDRGFHSSVLREDFFDLQASSLEALRGGGRKKNAEILQALLHGEDRGPKRDALLLNSAAAFFVAGTTKSLQEGWALAARLIDSGETARKLAQLRQK